MNDRLSYPEVSMRINTASRTQLVLGPSSPPKYLKLAALSLVGTDMRHTTVAQEIDDSKPVWRVEYFTDQRIVQVRVKRDAANRWDHTSAVVDDDMTILEAWTRPLAAITAAHLVHVDAQEVWGDSDNYTSTGTWRIDLDDGKMLDIAQRFKLEDRDPATGMLGEIFAILNGPDTNPGEGTP